MLILSYIAFILYDFHNLWTFHIPSKTFHIYFFTGMPYFTIKCLNPMIFDTIIYDFTLIVNFIE